MSSKKTGVFYLGRGGRVHGPFPVEKLEEYRLSGEIAKYTYIWEESSGQWKNIDPLPPEPGAAPAPRKGDGMLETADAICHDFNEIVSGQLENVSDMGCELVSHDHADVPKLALNSALVLNVLDGKGKKAVNVKASAYEITRRAGAWIYRIRWAQRPSF